MKTLITTSILLLLSNLAGFSQQPAANAIPEVLKPQFEVLNKGLYFKTDKRFPKAPADSGWLFHGAPSVGTIEVGFQGTDVVYMIFRRGVGGEAWTPKAIYDLHLFYFKDFLKEEVTYTPFGRPIFPRYNHALAPQINAAILTRKDFNVKSILGGL